MHPAFTVDIAASLTALATLVTAVGWAWSQVHNKRAIRSNTAKLDDVSKSVGPANGTSVHDLVTRVVTLDEYTHKSIHALNGKLTPIVGAMPTILTQLDTITKRLDDAAPKSAGT